MRVGLLLEVFGLSEAKPPERKRGDVDRPFFKGHVPRLPGEPIDLRRATDPRNVAVDPTRFLPPEYKDWAPEWARPDEPDRGPGPFSAGAGSEDDDTASALAAIGAKPPGAPGGPAPSPADTGATVDWIRAAVDREVASGLVGKMLAQDSPIAVKRELMKSIERMKHGGRLLPVPNQYQLSRYGLAIFRARDDEHVRDLLTSFFGELRKTLEKGRP